MRLGERFGLDRFFPGRLRPAWSFSVDGVIWRLIPSRNGFLAGEERDLARKRVSFFCLDARSGSVRWRGLSFGEPWWTGIEALTEQAAFIHGFAAPDMPGHRGIHAVDLASGRILWREEHLTFVAADRSTVYATRADGPSGEAGVVELDAASGELRRTLGSLPQLPRDDYDFVTYPLPAGVADAPEVAAALARQARGRAEMGAECIVTPEAAAVSSYHPLAGGKVEQKFSLTARPSGALLYRDIPAAEAPAPVPDSFFALGDLLYYIREKRTLIALPLPGGARP